MLASYMRRTHNNNLEIRIASSSCPRDDDDNNNNNNNNNNTKCNYSNNRKNSFGYHGNVTLMTNVDDMCIILLGITMLAHSNLKLETSYP